MLSGGDYGFLASWNVLALKSLLAWLNLGIAFSDSWESPELLTVMTVLNDFGEAFGASRFAQLLGRGSDTGQFTIRMQRSILRWPAGWNPDTGTVTLSLRFFSNDFMNQMRGPAYGEGVRYSVLGHEFGHAMLDGIRRENPNPDRYWLENRYARLVPVSQRALPGANNNESLVTDIAIYVGRGLRWEAQRTFFAAYVLPEILGTPVQYNGGKR